MRASKYLLHTEVARVFKSDVQIQIFFSVIGTHRCWLAELFSANTSLLFSSSEANCVAGIFFLNLLCYVRRTVRYRAQLTCGFFSSNLCLTNRETTFTSSPFAVRKRRINPEIRGKQKRSTNCLQLF